MERQHSEETSLWLQFLTRSLDMVPEEWRQGIFDIYISGKDTTKYVDGLRKIADRYKLNFNVGKVTVKQINVVPWTQDVELSDLKGSVLFDIFYKGELEKLKGYEEFREAIESKGSTVSYFPKNGIIRVYNNEKEVPIEVLGRAHKWAHENDLNHAYK
jgi:hypothetical protein